MFRPVSVLLVEDEALISEMIVQALIERGFAVHAVTTAADALRHLEAGSAVDILFTDINLPGDLDGAALAQHARALRPGLPVIYASGRWNLLAELNGVPRSLTLPKPYSPTSACEAVENLLAPTHAQMAVSLSRTL